MAFKRKTVEEFIREGTIKHKGKYDYSEVEYKGNKIKVCIICPIHGEFWQTPDRHLHSSGCLKCAAEKRGKNRRIDFETFKTKSNEVHNNKYVYIKEEFVKIDKKTKIICPIHGEFWQTPESHMNGHGCPACKKEKLAQLRKSEFGDFEEKARMVHGNIYDYSESKYVDSKTKVCIICPIHGKFWQSPNVHLRGYGCPKCHISQLEKSTEHLLQKMNVDNQSQQKFDWLINEKKMPLDFYLPQYNIAIECQGEQHLMETSFSKGNMFDKIISRDQLKYKLCQEHGIPIIYILNKKFAQQSLNEQFNHIYDNALFIEDIEENPQILLEKINEAKN